MISLPINKTWFASVAVSAAAFTIAPVAAAASFHEVPSGCAQEIAAGDGTSPWIIGCTEVGSTGNYDIYYWDSSSGSSGAWLETNGSAIQIGLMYGGGYNYPLLVNHAGTIYFGEPGGTDIGSSAGTAVTWSSLSGSATTISGSWFYPTLEDPTIYLTGTTSGGGGYIPYVSTNGLEGGWSSLGGYGVRISVSQDATELWLVNSSGSLYNYSSGWVSEPGSAIDVSAGSGTESDANVPPWMVSTSNVLEQWNGSGWNAVSGGPSAIRVSVGFNGTVWLIDTSGDIWYYN